jgi:hypothetical protein
MMNGLNSYICAHKYNAIAGELIIHNYNTDKLKTERGYEKCSLHY